MEPVSAQVGENDSDGSLGKYILSEGINDNTVLEKVTLFWKS